MISNQEREPLLFQLAANAQNKQWLENERMVRRLYQVKRAETQALLLRGYRTGDPEFAKLLAKR